MDNKNPTKNIITTDKPTEETRHNSSSSPSSQMQLLDLAKKFRLDGEVSQSNDTAPITERAHKRELLTHIRKQQNIEKIICKSIQLCSDNEVADRADHDWFSYFINLAENISNKTMQELWAKILACEVMHPGSFSLKTLQAFQLMSIHEAKLMAKACHVAVTDRSKSSYRIISGSYQIPGLLNFFSKDRNRKVNLAKFGLSYAELLTLADNHLLFIQETESNTLHKNEDVIFDFNGKPLTLTARKSDCVLSFYKFTPIGTELARLIAQDVNENYLEDLEVTIGNQFKVNSSS